jgi:hypothetical protein
VAVLEDWLILKKDSQLTVFIVGFASAGIRDDSVGVIENGDKTALLPHPEVVGFRAKTHSGVEVTSVNHGTTDVSPGEVDAAHVFAVEGEPVELVANAFGTDEKGFCSTGIDGNSVGLHEAAWV